MKKMFHINQINYEVTKKKYEQQLDKNLKAAIMVLQQKPNNK